MPKHFDYCLRAAEIAAKAFDKDDAGARHALLREAKHWMGLAENEEWLHDHSLTAHATLVPR